MAYPDEHQSFDTHPDPTAASAGETQSSSPPTPTDASDIVNKMAQGAHRAIDRLAEQATPIAQRVQTGVADAGDALQARAAQMRDMCNQGTESLRSTVRAHPLGAVLTALAFGMLLARLAR